MGAMKCGSIVRGGWSRVCMRMCWPSAVVMLRTLRVESHVHSAPAHATVPAAFFRALWKSALMTNSAAKSSSAR